MIWTLRFGAREEGCVWKKCNEVTRSASRELLWEGQGQHAPESGGGRLSLVMGRSQPCYWHSGRQWEPSACVQGTQLLFGAHLGPASSWLCDP